MSDFKKRIDVAIKLQNEKNFTEAKKIYDELIFLEPKNYPQLFFNRGIVNFQLNNHKESIIDFEKTISLKNDFVDAYLNISLVLKNLNFIEKSIYYLDQAIHIDKKNYIALNNRAVLNIKRRKFNLALSDLNEAIRINPEYINGFFARAYVHKELKFFKKSIDDFDKILEIDSSNSLAKLGKGLVYLLLGDFKMGFSFYEYRKHHPEFYKVFSKDEIQKLVNCDNLYNKIILIIGEQGLGDNIQFSRYIFLLINLGAKIFFQVENRFKNFFKRIYPDLKIYSKEEVLPDYHYASSLLSLPFLFKTNIKNIPKPQYNLNVDKSIFKKWAKYFNKDKINIGINWHSNPLSNIVGRSVPLKYFFELSKSEKIQLYSLQKFDDNEETKIDKNFNIISFKKNLDKDETFFDTSVIMMNLDLIITIDTSIAHLAGSLGKKVWLILNDVPEWRWQLDINYSHWYPSMTIFRCKKKDDWKSVFAEILNELKKKPSLQ